jgi:hypothetical protein
MNDINFHIIKPDDTTNIQVIANWYLSEWNIPLQTTIEIIKHLSKERYEFLPNGIYYYEIRHQTGLAAHGKVLKE